MALKFLLRPDMPQGFRENPNYAELPAAVSFLEQFEGREFPTESEFERTLGEFPKYLTEHRVPKSSDKALREGLLIEKIEGISDMYNISTRSDENSSGRCWFGSLGPEEIVRKYFQFQRDARTAQIIENDDTP